MPKRTRPGIRFVTGIECSRQQATVGCCAGVVVKMFNGTGEIKADTLKGKYDPEIVECLAKLLEIAIDSEDITERNIIEMQKTA